MLDGVINVSSSSISNKLFEKKMRFCETHQNHHQPVKIKSSTDTSKMSEISSRDLNTLLKV